jgi:hypothetical protein
MDIPSGLAQQLQPSTEQLGRFSSLRKVIAIRITNSQIGLLLAAQHLNYKRSLIFQMLRQINFHLGDYKCLSVWTDLTFKKLSFLCLTV